MDNISSVGHSWKEARAELYSPEKISESDLRVAIIGELIEARQEKGLTQRDLEQLSGVKRMANLGQKLRKLLIATGTSDFLPNRII